MKLSTIVAAVATVSSLLGTAASAGPCGVAIQLSTLGFPFHHGQPVTFTLNGKSVKGLYPGATKTIAMRVSNPYPFDLKVTQLAGKVIQSNRPACRPVPSNLVALPYDGSLPIKLKAKQSKSIGSIPLRMPPSVANGCQATTFTILMYGTATKVNK